MFVIRTISIISLIGYKIYAANTTQGVINHGSNARELMTEWTIKINDEILRKRNEFDLNN